MKKRKLLAIVLALAMTLSLLPVTALAEGEDDSNAITETQTETGLPAANDGVITLASGTYTLTTDVTASIVVPENVAVTLNIGDNCTVSNTANKDTITNSGTLTITGSGTVTNTTRGKGTLVNMSSGEVTLEGITMTRAESASWYVLKNHGTMTIKAGTTVNMPDHASSLIANGWYDGSNNRTSAHTNDREVHSGTATANIVIEDGTFAGGMNTVKNDDYGVLLIKDGTFTNTSGAAVLNWNIAEIAGGSFTVNSSSNSVIANGYLDDTADKGQLTISGGTFNAADGTGPLFGYGDGAKTGGEFSISDGIFNGSTATDNDYPCKPVITGGTYTDKQNVTTYLPANSNLTQDDNGKIVVDTDKNIVAEVNGVGYTSLNSAITAAQDGQVVKLLKDASVGDASEKKNFWINKSITLDLNQHILTGTYQIAVGVNNADADVTIKNGTLIGSETYCVYISAGNVTLDHVTINYAVTRPVQLGNDNSNNSLTVKNSTIQSTGEGQYGIMSFANKNKINIENSTVSADSFAVYHNGSYYGFEITTTDSTITSKSAQAVYISGSTSTTEKNEGKNQQATFTNCTITGVTGIEGKYTDISLKNCSITATADAPSFDQYNNGSTTAGFAVVSTDNSMEPASPAPNATVKIESGEYVGLVGLYQLIDETNEEFEDFKEATYEISGGSYSTPVNPAYLKDLNAELYSTAKNPDAPYSYYTDVAAAQEVAGPNDTIKDLSVDVDESKTYHTVTVDYADGASANEVYTIENSQSFTVPVNPTRTGYTFLYWKDAEGKTYKANDTLTVTADVKLTAQWSYSGGSSSGSSSGGSSTPTYSVTAPKADNGTVTVSPKNARKGAEVTITVKPDAGYEVDEVIVTDKNGKTIKVTEGRNGKYTFTMPASKVEVEVTFVKEYVAPAISFDDVSKGAWYYDAAIYAAENGIMSGTGGNNFSPDMTTSRAMIWTILARLDGQNVSVTYGNWYDKAQMWAMTNSVSDGTNPNGSITREQLAVMLYSYAQANGYTGKAGVSLSRYLDASDTSGWAVEAMEWAVGNGLISSTGGNLLSPTATATRAQVAVILMNFCENLVK